MKIAFIGGGNMGEAMLSSILEKGLASSSDITVGNFSEDRRQQLDDKYDINITGDNIRAIDGVDIVILAVKPQNFNEVTIELGGKLKPSQLVMSIIAGTTLDTLHKGLNHKSLVRVMPNTPARIGQGMSVWTATSDVTEQHKEWVRSILDAIGKEIYVDNEKYLHMVTAVSGSGPAYFFLFIEGLVEAAVNIGLPEDIALELALQTMIGSGQLIRESDTPPAELRRMVTSKGGTTEQALKEFEKGELKTIVGKAVTAAYNKARMLGGEEK